MLKQIAAYYYDLLMAIGTSRAPHLTDVRKAVRYRLLADLGHFGVRVHQCIDQAVVRLPLGARDPEDPVSEEDESEAPEETRSDAGVVDRAATTRSESQAVYRIHRKQLQDPFNRESILAFPWVSGRHGSITFCAPLLYFPVTLEVDLARGQAVVTKHTATPHVNVPLLRRLAKDDGEWEVLQNQLFARLYQGDLSVGLVQDLLRVLAAGCSGLEGLSDDLGVLGTLQEAMGDTASDGAHLRAAAVLINTPRSHAFLLEDLAELQKLDEMDGSSVIPSLLKETPDRIDLPDGEREEEGRLLFPFPSNKPQRRAARKAQHSRVLVVKGPPGTGKSQTIANLICHLVAHGSTVLMTSHQDKALDVVLKMLPDVGYLAMSMLKGEKESQNRLRGLLEAFEAEVANREQEQLRTARNRAVRELDENGRRIAELQVRFAELKTLERDRAPTYRRYADIKILDQVHDDDSIAGGQDRVVADALREWSRLQESLRAELAQLRELFGDADTPPDLREKRAQAAQTALALIGDWGKTKRPAGALELARGMREGEVPLPQAVERLRRILDWWSSSRSDIEDAVSTLRLTGRRMASLAPYRTLALKRGRSGCEHIRAAVEALHQTSEKIVSLGAPPKGFPSSPSDDLVARARYATETLSRTRYWVFWTLFPEARNARRELSKLGFPPVTHATRDVLAGDFKRWSEYWEAITATRAATQEFAKTRFIRADAIPDPQESTFRDWIKSIQLQARILCALAGSSVEDFPSRARALVEGRLDAAVDPGAITQASAWLRESLEILQRLAKLEGCQPAVGNPRAWTKYFAPLEAVILLGSDVVGTASALRNLFAHRPDYERLLRLESGPLRGLPRTRQRILDELQGPSPHLQWLARAEDAIEAHRLRRLIRDELQDVDDIGAIAREIQTLRARNGSLATKVLDAEIHLRLKAASEEPGVRNIILKLRSLLRGRRRTHSFVRLRDQIDYTALVKVFPCWVLGIEDVSRVFPLEEGLFDYLIIDEASQCNQAATLQLAYRAKRLIVVGDEHQLRNANSRFLDAELVAQLKVRHGLDVHPKSVFLDGRKSLLDFAESCANTSEFLNEHFRCERPIIRWSNTRFYNGLLQVLTPLRARRFSPTMEVRLVRGADEDRDTKVNEVEAKAVVREVRRLVDSGDAEGLTIGVISPFREQANAIQRFLDSEFLSNSDVVREHRIVSSTADGFQGDERDIVLYSFRQGPSSAPGSITAIEIERERINVAFTRARRKAMCFISRPIDEFPRGLIREFLEHAQQEANAPEGGLGAEAGDRFDSEFEKAVCTALRERGLTVFSQVPCAGFSIDLVAVDREGRRLAIECDGPFHDDPEGGLRPEDYQRQDIIERSGWYVYRVSYRRWTWTPAAIVEEVLQVLAQQPPEEARVVAEAEQGDAVEDAGEAPDVEPVEPMPPKPGIVVRVEPVEPAEPAESTPTAVPRQEVEEQPATAALAPRQPELPGFRPPVPAPAIGQGPLGPQHQIGVGAINEPRNWRELARWGRETSKIGRDRVSFADSMAHHLERKLSFTERQRRSAQGLWNAAGKLGFTPPILLG